MGAEASLQKKQVTKSFVKPDPHLRIFTDGYKKNKEQTIVQG